MMNMLGITAMTRPTFRNSRRTAARNALVALLAALPVAACQQGGPLTTASVPLSVAERHPIGVVPERVVLDVDAFAGAISPSDAAELETFVLAYGQEGNGPLYVLAPEGRDRRGAELIYAEARRVAHNSGIPVAAISYAGYEPAGGPAPVKLLYERMVAATVCGQWPENADQDLQNAPYYNFGCATQKNLAAMLEDPRDLQGPRPTTPRDLGRRDVVLEKYRLGESTAAAIADDDAGTVSEVGD